MKKKVYKRPNISTNNLIAFFPVLSGAMGRSISLAGNNSFAFSESQILNENITSFKVLYE